MLPRSQLRKRTAPDVERRGSHEAIAAVPSEAAAGGVPRSGHARKPGSSVGLVIAVVGLATASVLLAVLRHSIFPTADTSDFAATVLPDLSVQPPSALVLAQLSETIYQRSRDRRAKTLTASGGVAGVNPFDQVHGVYIWDWFTPDWNCPDRERIGPVGDGGKWTCGIDMLRRRDGSRCLMYSYGVRDDSRFELEVVRRVGCDVHAFDPTVGGLPPDAAEEPRIHYHKQAVGPKTGHDDNFLIVESILDSMARLGHQWLDILKIDVEASEWSVFEALVQAGKLPFSQILIELHYADPAEVFRFFDSLERHGFRIFARETNHQPCVAGRLPVAVEFSLIRSPLAPWPPPTSQRVMPVRPRAVSAAVWVMSHAGRLPELLRTVRGLASGLFLPWNLRGQYPLIIFAPEADINEIRVACSAIVFPDSVEIRYEPIAVSSSDWPSWRFVNDCGDGAGGASYWAVKATIRKRLADQFDWIMQVGDDAELVKPFGYDPFVMLDEVGKSYGALGGLRPEDASYYPSSDCVARLSDTARAYASSHGLEPLRNATFGRHPSLAGSVGIEFAPLPLLLTDQLEVCRSSFFRRGSAYADIHDALSVAPGAYLPGFGDAPLHTLYAAMALPEEQWHIFSDVGMSHRGGGGKRIAEGLPPPRPRSPLAEGGRLHADFGQKGHNRTNASASGGPEYPRQKAAMYVVANGRRVDRLIEMLQSLDRHFNSRFNYPIVVFDEDLLPVQKSRLSAATHTPLTFVPVEFRLPPFIAAEKVPAQTGCLPERGFGYRHMCRFQAGFANLRLAEMGYEWHWRMDDDSLLTGDIPYDVFGFMAEKGALYGYISTVDDDDACIVDLWDTAKVYAQRAGAGVTSNFFKDWPIGRVFYNNFEIAHASIFTGPEYRAYFDHIDQHGGIYTRRWGDAPIKSIAVSLFLPPSKLHRFGDIGYRHAPFVDQAPAIVGQSGRGGGDRHRASPQAALIHKVEQPVSSVIGRFHIEARPDADLQRLIAPRASADAPGWIGADVATSVKLPSGEGSELDTYLWLFGDTLIGSIAREGAEGTEVARRVKRAAESGGFFVRNSVGFWKVSRRTRKPLHSMIFSWTPQTNRGQGDKAALPLLSGDKNSSDWFWPLAALSYCQAGNTCELLIVGAHCAPVRPDMTDMADPFVTKGSVAMVVRNPKDSPDLWMYSMKHVPVPAHEGLVSWHAGVVRADEQGLPDDAGMWVYFLGTVGTWKRQTLARVPLADLAKLDFKAMEVWSKPMQSSAPGWNLLSLLPPGDAFAQSLVIIGGISETAAEAGLWFDTTLRLWYIPLVVQDKIVLRTASILTGPWSSHVVYQLPERWSRLPQEYFAYAVKSHPELAKDGEILLSYNVNLHRDPLMAKLFDVGEADTYVPQFLRLEIRGEHTPS